jgi:transcriptional regulator with XRE-family HTH domain
MTQRDLAEKLDVAQSYISNCERGARGLSTELLVRVAHVLGVTADELLGLQKERANGRPLQRRFLRRLQRIDDLPEDEQRALLKTLDAFLERAELRGTVTK